MKSMRKFTPQLHRFKTILLQCLFTCKELTYLQEDHLGYEVMKPTFFQEDVVYWDPGSDCASIYEQLAQKMFREIFREHIE